jgi:hypothetical protein
VVPIYLGDSVQWSRDAGTLGLDTITIEVDSPDLATVDSESHEALFSSGEQLVFPVSVLENPNGFDRLMNELAAIAHGYTDASKPKPSIAGVLENHGVESDNDRNVLRATFATLCDLNAANRDHIWAYFVRNQIRPLWLSSPERRMTLLIGNPPWVAYRFMTAAMQAQFKTFAMSRNIWTGGRLTPTQDLVALFIARVVEQFLSADSPFAFVVPNGVLSRQQFEGFRTGRWAQGIADGASGAVQTVNVAFDVSWDLKGVKPPIFPAPAAVLFGKRAAEPVGVPSDTVEFVGRVGSITETGGETVGLTEA